MRFFRIDPTDRAMPEIIYHLPFIGPMVVSGETLTLAST